MNCEQMNGLLSAWLDGELTGPEEAQMQSHLEQCAACRALLEQLQALHTSFEELEELDAPEHFAQSVMERIAAEAEPKVVPLFRRPQVRRLAGLAACALVCIGIGRVALNGNWGASYSEPGSVLPEAADYAEPESAVEECYGFGTPAECARELPETDAEPVEEPTAPSAAVQTTAGDEIPLYSDEKNRTEALRGGSTQLILKQLPEGLEERLGQLAWEARLEDGAQCAPLTREQAELLLELADAQDLPVEEIAADEGEAQAWTLVYLPD